MVEPKSRKHKHKSKERCDEGIEKRQIENWQSWDFNWRLNRGRTEDRQDRGLEVRGGQ